jgi:hypothetical protein
MKKVLICFDDDLKKDVVDYCKRFKYTQSELIRQSLREKLYFTGTPRPEFINKTDKSKISEENRGPCENHYDERYWKRKKIRFEDLEGNVLWEKNVCEPCEISLKDASRGQPGTLYVNGARYEG